MPKVDDKKKEYDVLGLEITANEVEVKKAFTSLALKYHPDKSVDQETQQYTKSKFHEICKSYKKIMADENCSVADWNNDKSDEIFFSLLGELLQNSTRAGELYTLLSSQANSRSQFQNDNEYRCKEDAMEDEDDESELNKLVDILKNRLQNGKSVPAGLTQEKLTRLKDDLMKQKEENRRTEQSHHTPTKKAKSSTAVPVAKPKPKNKKQLQAEQRRRELEMANIAKELEEKKKKDEEKEQVRKKQEKERKRILEEEMKKQEEDKKRHLNENKKKKEREEKEKEQRTQKEKERQERLKKSQEEEQRKKEEEKRRKAEEKAAKQKAMKDTKEREERDKIEKQPNQKNQTKLRSQQYQQYQQQQQKYPREVPPRFLRQQQMKQQVPRKEQDYTYTDSSQYREDSGWTEITPDTRQDNNTEDWDLDINPTNNFTDHTKTDSSWGGIPVSEDWGGISASEDWDLDINKPSTRSSFTQLPETKQEHSPIGSEVKPGKAVESLFSPSDPPLSSFSNITPVFNNDSSWGVSLTGSTWDTGNTNVKQWDSNSNVSKTSMDECRDKLPVNGFVDGILTQSSSARSINNPPSSSSHNATNWNKSIAKPVNMDALKSGSPGITPWAGLDSFDAGPTQIDNNNTQTPMNNFYSGGAKPKTTPVGSFHSYHSDLSEKARQQKRSKEYTDHNDKRVNVPSIDNKVDSNLKVCGWLQNSTPPEDWDENEKESNDGEFGWTTVSLKTKQKLSTGNSQTSAPGTPSKSDGSNAWTTRALKQLLDMGFKRDHAEKALRDNNGIIESAVSDLLMQVDSTTDSPSQVSSEQTLLSKSCTSNDLPPSGENNQADTPQKLNRKQRRKLQQMQNAEQGQESSNIVSISLNKSNDTITGPQDSEITIKPKGDGLLPTPPPSHRIILSENSTPAPLDKTVGRTVTSKAPGELVGVIQKPAPRSGQQSIGQQPPSHDVSQNVHLPIGSSRPSAQAHIQPPTPIQPPKSQASQPSTSSTKESLDKMNGTTLQPPVNPVLLAQMHLQKLGLEDAPTAPVSFSGPAPVSSQTVTNSMIQQYLQQIAQAPDVETTPSVSASSITAPLATSMHLSGLLQQAPIPATSLSDGPQKSKLLQWTQPSSTSNSEPTTPPSAEDKAVSQNVDPVSAKWGVLAAPRLSPTPAEFKPGVPWKSRGDIIDSKEDAAFVPVTEPETGSTSATPLSKDLFTPDVVKQPTRLSPKIQPMKPLENNVSGSVLISTVNSTKPEPTVVRPPPGLVATNSFVEVKNCTDDMSWLVLKGLSSAVDPSPIRNMCQQFGTLLHFRVIGNVVYVRYETVSQAQTAWLQLNGKIVFNTQILAEVSSETECIKAMETATLLNNTTVVTVPLTTQVTQQPIAPVFPNVSSFGGLWTTPGQAAPPQAAPQQLFQQSFPAAYGAPTTIGMNGGFSHWGMPSAQAVIPNASHLWATGPQQPANVFQAYPGWLTTKQEVPVQASMFNPGVDLCLPSELFNAKEQGS